MLKYVPLQPVPLPKSTSSIPLAELAIPYGATEIPVKKG